MRKRVRLKVIMMMIAAGLFGWLAACGEFAVAFAQDKNPKAAQADGSQLPKPDPEFKGTIGETYKESSRAPRCTEGMARQVRWQVRPGLGQGPR
jgi:hypothetical protein